MQFTWKCQEFLCCSAGTIYFEMFACGATSMEHHLQTYQFADMKSLFHAQSAAEYDSLLQSVKQDWDASFEEYFPYSGVTNNKSEGFSRQASCTILFM